VRFDRALLTASFVQILGLTLLGFVAEYVLRPVIPLMILDRGGGATVIGLIVAVYAIPPIVLRPMVGMLTDRWRAARVLRIGTVLASVSPVALLLPGIAALVPTRLVQGTAWALNSVATRTLMAEASPPHRRGAASGYFMAMTALAVLVAPGLGVAAYLATGVIGPTLIAIGVALCAFAIALRIPTRSSGPSHPDIARPSRAMEWIMEPSAVPAMVMTATFLAADTLFTVFPPVYVALTGDPVEALAVYYPAYGLVMAAGHFGVGWVSDRLGRGLTIRIGCVLGAVGLVVAVAGEDIIIFGAGAATYAIGASLASPALSALSIDRAPVHRLGSAMATYSIGYQLAIGGSSLIWGPLITAAGFDAALATAMLLVLLTMVASYRYGDGRVGQIDASSDSR
jgi:predicted MFS family arabinose efflux permease